MKINKNNVIASVSAAISALFINTAQAKAPEIIGDYNDWSAYFIEDSGGKTCYMASAPKSDEGKYTQRGNIYAVVTHRPKDKTFDVVNFNAGYTYKQDAPITVKIGKNTINKLFADGDKAWAVNDSVDKELVALMRRGDRMIVHGTSSKGTATKDTYSLKGFNAAYKAISMKCGKR